MRFIHTSTVNKVSTALQNEQPDITFDSGRESEINFFNYNNQNLQDKLTRIESHTKVLTIENDQDDIVTTVLYSSF